MGRSIASEPEEFLPTGESIGVRTRRGGKVGERAGEGGRGLQIESGVGPGSTGDPPVPSGDSPDGTRARFSSMSTADRNGAGESPALPIFETRSEFSMVIK